MKLDEAIREAVELLQAELQHWYFHETEQDNAQRCAAMMSTLSGVEWNVIRYQIGDEVRFAIRAKPSDVDRRET